MRVLTVGNMYPPHHLGGYELMWQSTVRHLRSAGHEVRAVTTDYHRDGAGPEEDADVFRDLRWYWEDHRFPRLGARRRVAVERHNAGVFDGHVRDFRPDVLNWWAMGGMSLSLIERGRRAGLPASSTVVDDWLLYGPEVDQWSRLARRLGPLAPPLARLTGITAPRVLPSAGRWLFASRTLRTRAEDAGWALPDVTVAYPGIDHCLFAPPRPAREEWSWKLLYCGRIDRRKGIHLAIEALAGLPAQATLRVVGGGDDDHAAELRSKVAELGLTERVAFESVDRSSIPGVYADADLTLFPVLWPEPFGLVPLESMAMGTPVVASGRGGSAEYLTDGTNCVLFDAAGGADPLRAAIDRVASSADLRRDLHAGGIETAARFTAGSFDRAVEEDLLAAAGRG